jgi:DDE superfamily endonuclease
LKKEWCIPPKASGAFVAQLEEVLDLYEKPYDSRYPLACMDETSKQLVNDAQAPLPPQPGQIARQDYEYERNGVCNLFICFEPLRSQRHVQVTDQRTAVDWAHFMKAIAETLYPDAKKIVVVLDNLNTHGPGSFYEAFAPAEAKRLAARFEFHYTPKHGSWLNMAEIELSAMSRMCLDRRIPDKETLVRDVSAWESERNAKSVTVDWRFTTDDARIKLKKLYPTISV